MHKLTCGDVVCNIRDNETIMQCLERYGVDVKHSCRNGHCGICKANIISGRFYYKSVILFSDGITICKAYASSNIEIELRN